MSSRKRRRQSNPWRLAVLAVPIALCVSVMLWLARPQVDAIGLQDQATQALNEGRLPDARSLLEQLHQERPDDHNVTVMLATVAGFQGEPETAIELFSKVPGFDRNPSLLLQAGKTAMDGYLLNRADELLSKCLELQPQDAGALRMLAMLRTMLMDSAGARTLFIELDRQGLLTAQDILTIVMADRIRSDVDENTKHLRSSLKMEPGSPRAIAAMIDNFLTLGRASEANAFVKQSVLTTDNKAAWLIEFAKASIAFADADVAGAATMLAELPAVADGTARVWLLKGKVLERLGNLSAAQDCFGNAAALDPLDPEAPFLMARVLEKLGSGDPAERANLRHRAIRLQSISVETGALINFDSQAEAAERLVPLCSLLIEVGATREAAVTLSWLQEEGYTFGTMQGPQAALKELGDRVPRVLGALPTEPLRTVHADAFGSKSSAPAVLSRTTVTSLVSPLFSDITDELNVRFKYACPESDRTEILSSLGGGVACFDFDLDGHVDLFFPQGGRSPEHRELGMDVGSCLRRGVQSFIDVTNVAGFTAGDYSQGTAVSDFNNDGFDDLLMTSFGVNQLWINLGDGTFELADKSCLDMPYEWSSSAVFADLDNDSDDDLYVVNYLDDLCPEIKIGDCGPRTLNARQDRLYENAGDGTFREITETSGIVTDNGKGLGIVAADFDRDGRLDVFVGNDATANFLWANESASDGIRLKNIAVPAGVAVGSDGRPQACMGVAIADVDANGYPDLFVSNFEFETNTFYSNLGSFQFADQTKASGLEAGSYALMGWGAQFLNLDDDALPDLALMNGFLDARPLQPQLYIQTNDGFQDVSKLGGSYFESKSAGRGLAVCDLNNDGVEDIVSTHRSGRPTLLQSSQKGDRRFTLELSGRSGSRTAHGALVSVTTDGHTTTKELFAGGGYLCANQRMLSLPCGTSGAIESLRVQWPGGHVDQWTGIKASPRMIAVESSEGRTAQLLPLVK